jgi:DNA-binding NarL/FixJ family response regulator
MRRLLVVTSIPTDVLSVALVSSTPSLHQEAAQAVQNASGLTWFGAVADPMSAIEWCRADCPDILLVDSDCDREWNLCLLLSSMFTELAIVVLLRGQVSDRVSAAWARLHGVHGLIGLDAAGQDLVTAIRTTAKVGKYVHPDIDSSHRQSRP